MSSQSRHPGAGARLSSEAWQRLEEILERFEAAWRRGEHPLLDDYLAGVEAERGALLVELVHEELELRLKAGEPARVEEYLERYPELRAVSAAFSAASRARLASRAALRSAIRVSRAVVAACRAIWRWTSVGSLANARCLSNRAFFAAAAALWRSAKLVSLNLLI